MKRRLKKIQYRSDLVDGCLAVTVLSLDGWPQSGIAAAARLVGMERPRA
ncbi:hypothetical protein [Streptomyces sp. NPDC048643]